MKSKRLSKEFSTRICRKCFGAGEYPRIVEWQMQLSFEMIRCRCREGVTC